MLSDLDEVSRNQNEILIRSSTKNHGIYSKMIDGIEDSDTD